MIAALAGRSHLASFRLSASPMHDERKTAPIEAKLPKRSRSKPLSPVLKAAPTTSGERRLQLAVRS
jgi:hypothetical protein